MEFLFGTLLSYLMIAVVGLGILYLLLLLIIIFRQRRVVSKMTAMQKSIATTMEDAAGHQRVNAEKQLTKIAEAFQALDPVTNLLAEIDEKLNGINNNLEVNQGTLTDSLMEISSSVASSEKSDDELFQIRERIDKIQGDISQAHRWLDELRLLEKVVLKLIGPDKLRSLVEKERGFMSEAKPASTANASTKKSLL